MTAYSAKNGTINKASDDQNAGADCTIALDYIGDQGFRYYATPSVSSTVHNITFHWTANARM